MWRHARVRSINRGTDRNRWIIHWYPCTQVVLRRSKQLSRNASINRHFHTSRSSYQWSTTFCASPLLYDEQQWMILCAILRLQSPAAATEREAEYLGRPGLPMSIWTSQQLRNICMFDYVAETTTPAWFKSGWTHTDSSSDFLLSACLPSCHFSCELKRLNWQSYCHIKDAGWHEGVTF